MSLYEACILEMPRLMDRDNLHVLCVISNGEVREFSGGIFSNSFGKLMANISISLA